MAASCRPRFLSLMGAIYFCAFATYYLQYPGLLGEDGLLPARRYWEQVRASYLPRVDSASTLELDVESALGFWTRGVAAGRVRLPAIRLAGAGEWTRFRAFLEFPCWLWFLVDGTPSLQVDQALEGLALAGMALSAVAVLGVHHVLVFALLYLNYLSLFLLGQRWLGFQWDIFLLETGAMILLYCPFWRASAKEALPPVAWLLRALWVKFMFMNGVVKVTADCPTWKHLTALEYHFASTCLPTSEAWIHHQLPPFVLRFGVAVMFVVELALPWLLLVPIVTVRRVGVLFQAPLQLAIMATGNYNWFNAHALVMLLPAWDDDDYGDDGCGDGTEGIGASGWSGATGLSAIWRATTWLPRLWGRAWASGLGRAIAVVGSLAFAVASSAAMFGIRTLDASGAGAASPGLFALPAHLWKTFLTDHFVIESHHGSRDLTRFMAVSFSRRCLGAFFALVALSGFRWALAPALAPRFEGADGAGRAAAGRRMAALCAAVWRLGVCALVPPMLVVCLLPLESIHRGAVAAVPFAATVTPLDQALKPWHCSSSYGLFRRMTGVGDVPPSARGRGWGGLPPSVVAVPGVVLEGSDDGAVWREIPFRYALGETSRQPRRTAPHQPRLDWQMWFAALGSYQHNDWFVHLAYKVLEGAESVLALLDNEASPWPRGAKPPKLVRAWLYHYDFTRFDTPWARSVPGARLLNMSSGSDIDEWWARKKVHEYMPTVSTVQLKDIVRQQGWPLGKARLAAVKRARNCTSAHRASYTLGIWCDAIVAARRAIEPVTWRTGWSMRCGALRALWPGASDLFFLDVNFALILGPLLALGALRCAAGVAGVLLLRRRRPAQEAGVMPKRGEAKAKEE